MPTPDTAADHFSGALCDTRCPLAVRRRRSVRVEGRPPPVTGRPSVTDREVFIVQIANIGAREIRKRQTLGLVSAVAAGVLGFVVIGYDAPRWARLGVFLPLWLAGLGVFQAREKT